MPKPQAIIEGTGFDQSGVPRCRLTMVTPEGKTVGQTIDMMLLALSKGEAFHTLFHVSSDTGAIYCYKWKNQIQERITSASEARGEPK